MHDASTAQQFGHPVSFCAGSATRPGESSARWVDGLIIDVPDLVFDATLWRRWLLRLLKRMGLQLGYDEFSRRWDQDYLLDVHRGRREYSEALEAFLHELSFTWAQIDEIQAAGRIHHEQLELSPRPLPGVVSSILELRAKGIALLAWADCPWPGDQVSECLARLGLAGQFHAILSSCELEVAQPTANAYSIMLQALQLPAQRVLYVGHDTAHLAGASSFGLHTCACNHRSDARADYFLTQFAELPRLLAQQAEHSPPNLAQPVRVMSIADVSPANTLNA